MLEEMGNDEEDENQGDNSIGINRSNFKGIKVFEDEEYPFLNFEPYSHESEIFDIWTQRSKIFVRDEAEDLLSILVPENLENVKNEGILDDFIEASLKEIVNLDSKINLADSTSYFKLSSIENLKIMIDGYYNIKLSSQPLILVLKITPEGFDWESFLPFYMFQENSPKSFAIFSDPGVELPKIEDNITNGLLFILFSLKLNENEEISWNQIGFSILPLYTSEETPLTGLFQLPLVVEKLDDPDSFDIIEKINPWKFSQLISKEKKNSKFNIIGASLVIRIYPDILDDVFLQDFDADIVNTMFLPPDFPENYILNPDTIDYMIEQPPELIPVIDNLDPDFCDNIWDDFMAKVDPPMESPEKSELFNQEDNDQEEIENDENA